MNSFFKKIRKQQEARENSEKPHFYLPPDLLRKKCKHFKGKADHQTKLVNRTGEDVLNMVKDVKVVFEKAHGSEPIPNDADGHAPMWKKSIFWKLPYWQVLEVHSAIDVMHLTKNLCVNLLGFMGVYGQPKDTLEARQDLRCLKERDNLHPEKTEDGRHYFMCFASVSEACFKCFICFQTYVAIVASKCFKTRLGVASPSPSSASPRCQAREARAGEGGPVPTGVGGPHVHVRAHESMQYCRCLMTGNSS